MRSSIRRRNSVDSLAVGRDPDDILIPVFRKGVQTPQFIGISSQRSTPEEMSERPNAPVLNPMK